MRTTRILAVAFALVLSAVPSARAQEYTPSYGRIRAALERNPVKTDEHLPVAGTQVEKVTVSVFEADRSSASGNTRGQGRRENRDSVWNGVLLGAAVGAGGGYVWARNICGSNDTECFSIAGPVGVLSGAGIGAAVGAIVDALHR